MINSQDQMRGNADKQLSYWVLFRKMQSDQADISSLLDAVESAQRLFRSRSNIYRQQCEHVASILRQVLEPVRDLLDMMPLLPGDLAIHSASLVATLNEVIKAVEDLAPLITHYPFTDRASSHPTVAQRWDIQHKFDGLIHDCHSILRQANRLLDRAYVQAAL
ncbi:MAG TPA: hypothetical protein VJ761_17715 [Ktedonobacteraceae bacterium]|nr:hypothetical protein [Ktedonobacteraceae bacterium]